MKTSFLILAISLLSACSEDASVDKVHDVEFYLADNQARLAMINRCDNNPGLYQEDPNCINAEQARRQHKSKEFLKSLESK